MLRFQAFYQPAPWGGRRLYELFGRPLPEGLIGESWELCEVPEHPERDSVVVTDCAFKGQTLGALWRAGELGGSAKGPFPFLLKWLDAMQRLSVQVHPDEAACQKLGKGSSKTEAWYVAEVDSKASLLIGHYPGLDAMSLRQSALGGTLQKWLYETRPRLGDMYLLKAGTIHAIGGGLLLLEVQQPSDTTFRIYDWGRVGSDGLPRQLHLEEAAASVAYQRFGAPQPARYGVVGPTFLMRTAKVGSEFEAAALRVFTATLGGCVLTTRHGEERLEYGDVVVAQPSDGVVRVASGSVVFVGEPS